MQENLKSVGGGRQDQSVWDDFWCCHCKQLNTTGLFLSLLAYHHYTAILKAPPRVLRYILLLVKVTFRTLTVRLVSRLFRYRYDKTSSGMDMPCRISWFGFPESLSSKSLGRSVGLERNASIVSKCIVLRKNKPQ